MTERTSTARRIELVVDPWDDCTEQLSQERDRYAGFADIRNALGMLLLEQGRAGEAVAEFDVAIKINPEYYRARFNRLVAVRVRDGQLSPGVWSAENLVSKVENPERCLWTSWYLAQSDDATGARQALEQLSSDPQWAPVALFNGAVRSQMRGNVRAIRQALRKAAAAHPLYRKILEERGIVPRSDQSVRTSPGEILGTAAHPSTWHPFAATVYEQLGDHCARLGALDQATRFYEDAFLRSGDESAHLVRMANIALSRGDEEAAVQALCRAIEIDPTSVDARIALGFEYQSQGYHDEALIQFEVAARLQPSYPDIQYNLGLLYQAQAREEDALKCLRSALEINPCYFQARTSLAQLLLQRECYEETLEVLEPLAEQGIRSADLMAQKAEAHMALGQFAMAIEELERAADLNPIYPRTYYVLGQAYRNQGLKRKAQEAWKQYLERSRRWKEEQPLLEGEEWTP